MARLKDFYKDSVVKAMTEQFGYTSVMQVPRIDKITLNMGVGEAVADKKVMEHAVGDMEKIAGQKAIVTKAKKSVAAFKIRDDYPVGCKVTLRRERMYEFLDRLVTVAIPRIRDFRGISAKSFDGRGNYNMGVGEAVADKKVMEHAVGDMEKIAGQKAIVTKAKKSVAAFKIRDDYPVGCKVTLRRERMYEFLDRLVTVAIPRIRDFRGISAKSFDGRGNYNMGVKEQIIFPEIEYDKIDAIRGMNITITTTAKTDEEAKALLAAFSFPFRG